VQALGDHPLLYKRDNENQRISKWQARKSFDRYISSVAVPCPDSVLEGCPEEIISQKVENREE